MTTAISNRLRKWIAEAEAWQIQDELGLPIDAQAYDFLNRNDDFFITVFCKAIESLIHEPNETTFEERLNIAKALETYSPTREQDIFSGINRAEAMIIAAVLRTTAGYSSSGRLIAELIPSEDAKTPELRDCLYLLRRDQPDNDFEWSKAFNHFLDTGAPEDMDEAIEHVQELSTLALDTGPDEHISSIALEATLTSISSSNIWSSLRGIHDDLDFWADYAKNNVKDGIWSFFPSQQEAIDAGVVQSNTSYSLQMPTSSGKTALCELIIFYYLKTNPQGKVLLLAPFRALASELKISMRKRLSKYGIKVRGLYGGGTLTSDERLGIEEASLIIATPEKMMAVENVLPTALSQVGLVICDEGHLLDDSTRGFDYELFLSRLKMEMEDSIRFVYLSAIVPNLAAINDWLGGSDESLVSSLFRPTSINIAFVEQTASGYNLYVNPGKPVPESYRLKGFIEWKPLKTLNPDTGRMIHALTNRNSKRFRSAICAIKATKMGGVALFCPNKRDFGVAGISHELIRIIDLIRTHELTLNTPLDYADEKEISRLLEYFTALLGQDHLLTQACAVGFLYHHGSLPQFIREIIEDALRQEWIRLVVCTNTLAEGVNLPLRTMVIHKAKRNTGEGWEAIPTRDLKNLIGRTGRAGKERDGWVLVPHLDDRVRIANALSDKNLEPVRGHLYSVIKNITRILRERRLELSNGLLEQQNESFLGLLDSIDRAIIDAVRSDTTSLDELNEIAEELIKHTFSHKQASEEEQVVFARIINLRADRIKESTDAEQLKTIKKAGLSFRLHGQVRQDIDSDSPLWTETTEPDSEEWVKFILNAVKCLSPIKHLLESEQFPEKIRQPMWLENLVLHWMKGESYLRISHALSTEVDTVLELLTGLVPFNLANAASGVIGVISENTADEEELPHAVAQWPLYLQHGINSRTQYLLTQLGFIERIGTLALSNHIDTLVDTSMWSEPNLKTYLKRNRRSLLNEVNPTIPDIAGSYIKKSIRALS